MGKNKKKNHPTVEDILARPWCYYCERDFDDQKILINHQKAKHFKCDHCNRRLSTAGGLFVHLQQVHKLTLTVIDNALEGRQNVEPEIFGMMGIPEELVEAHRQRVMNAFFKEQADRRAQTGNPPPGQGQPNPRKRKVDEPISELKARAAEFRAKRAAERQAQAEAEKEGKVVQKSSSNTPDPTKSSANPNASDYMAPPPPPSYDLSYYERPQQLPQFAPYPGLPLQSPQGVGYPPSFPIQQPGQWSSNMPPHSFSPPQAAPYATPSFMPPVRPPVTSQMPSMATPNHNDHYSPTITRQPVILQPAPGLPARPSFDPPSFNREDMQRMHGGQAPPQANNAGQSRPVKQPRKPTAVEEAVEEVERMLKRLKEEFLREAKILSDYDALKQSLEEIAQGLKTKYLQKQASNTTSNASQDAANPVPATMTHEITLRDVERDFLKQASRAAANGTQGAADSVPEHGPASQYVHSRLVLVKPKAPAELIYDHHDESPEQKMAKRSKYAFQRNGA